MWLSARASIAQGKPRIRGPSDSALLARSPPAAAGEVSQPGAVRFGRA